MSNHYTPRHRVSRQSRLGAFIASLASFALVLGLIPLTTIPLLVASAPPAAAAPTQINVGTIQVSLTRMSVSATTGNYPNNECLTYAPAGGTANQTAWVTGTTEAFAGHSRPQGNNVPCPTEVNTATQSTISVQANTLSGAVNEGEPFLLASYRHYNRPVALVGFNVFYSTFGVRMLGTDLSLPWSLWETPNTNSCPPGVSGSNGDCNDILTFNTNISPQTVTVDGRTFRLVVAGFVNADGQDAACPATPDPSQMNDVFSTAERVITKGCLYGKLEQVRNLTIEKVVQLPNGQPVPAGVTIPGFSYGSTSDIPGSPWASNFTLNPNSSTPGTVTRELLSTERIVVSEVLPSGDQWSLSSVTCVDQNGAPVGSSGGNGWSVAGTALTINNIVGLPSTPDSMKCTFVNTYTPKSTLTLVKSVSGGSATPNQWTLNANGPTPISGTSGSAAVTNQRVTPGVYTLSELAGPAGYVQQGAWSCTGGTLNGNQLTLADGQSATCTVTNRFTTGTLNVQKLITGATAGYTGGDNKVFTGTVTCSNPAATYPFSVTPATAAVINNVPAGSVCAVTAETPPTDGLANSSFSWGTPVFGVAQTVVDGATTIVTVTNPITQSFGYIAARKTVQPAAGVTPGYTGATTRTFPISYSCTLPGSPDVTGTVNLAASSQSAAVAVPVGATCTFTEPAPTVQPGDFADSSYYWNAPTLPANITVTAAMTAAAPGVGNVINTYDRTFAAIQIAKTVSGPGAGSLDPDMEFSVAYDCGGPYTGTVTLTNGQTLTVPDLPLGVTCTVTETPPTGSVGLGAAYAWGTPTYTPTNQQAVVATTPNVVTIDNPTVQLFGQLQVRKSVTGATEGLLPDVRFLMDVVCDQPAQGQTANYSGTLQVGANTPALTPFLPIGTQCTVTEQAPEQAFLLNQSYGWGPTPGPEDGTVASASAPTTVTITNNIVRVYGSLTVAKTVVNPYGDLDLSGATFSGTYTCTGNTNVQNQPWSGLSDGGTVLVSSNILLGSNCTVTETPPSLDNPLYAWGAPTYSPPQPVAVNATTPHREVTITNTVRQVASNFQLTKIVTGDLDGLVAGSQFTISANCVPPAGDDSAPIDESWTLENGDTDSTSRPIPAGSICTVTEQQPRPATSNPVRFEWGQVQFTTNLGTPITQVDANTVRFEIPIVSAYEVALLTVTNPLNQLVGSINVAKVVTGETAGLVPGTQFPITVDCGDDGVFPFPLLDGGDNTVHNLPAGASCTITEGSRPALKDLSYRWVDAVITPSNVTVVAGETANVLVTNEIERVYNDVMLAKTITDPDGVVDTSRVYSVDWQCLYEGTVVASGTNDVTAGAAPITVGQAPITSVCAATGEDLSVPPSTDPSYVWAAPVFGPGVEVTRADPAVMTVANSVTRGLGTLQVRKQLTGATAGVPDGSLFPVSYACTSGSMAPITGTVNVPVGDTFMTLANNVPFGWECTISEGALPALVDGSYAWGTPTISPATVTLSAATVQAQITVTNPVERVYGALSVTKELPGVPAGAALDEFSGTWSCQYGDDPAVTGTWAVPVGGGPATLSGGGNNGTELLVGSICTVTEDALPALASSALTWNTPVISGPVDIGANATVDVRVTNTVSLATSSLTITKELADGMTADGLLPDATVSGSWSCTYEGVPGNPNDDVSLSGRWTLPAAGGSTAAMLTGETTPAQIPIGSSCLVVEDTLIAADTFIDGSYEWLAPTYQPANGTVNVAADGSSEVTVTNSYERVMGNFTVQKQVEGGIANSLIVYRGDWSCQYTGNPDTTDDDVLVTSTADTRWLVSVGGTWTSPAVLVGSECSVTSEDRLPTPKPEDPSWIWTDQDLGNAVTITRVAQGLGEITVTNTMTRVYGAFAVLKKVLEGDPANPDATFGFVWHCIPGDGTPELEGSFSLADGESFAVETGQIVGTSEEAEIPAGSVCTVTESLPDVADGASGYWSAPMWTVVTVPSDDEPVLNTSEPSLTATGDVPLDPSQTELVTAYNVFVPTGYEVAKTSDPASGSAVLPGQTITYTVSVTPQPAGTGLVVVTDDMRDVLSNATLVPGSINTSIGAATLTGDELVWTIPELTGTGPDFSEITGVSAPPAAEPVTMTYQVLVNEDAWNVTLRNAITTDSEQDCLGDCTPWTEHPTPGFQLSKTSDPVSGSAVVPEQVVTYTLHLTNPTAATMPTPAVIDDLSDVFDDATWLGFTGTVPGTAELVDSTLHWTSADLPAGATVTLSYQVKVKAGTEDKHLRNVAVPGIGGTCVDDEDDPCITTHDIPAFTVTKTSDPASGSTVKPGQVITYTITVVNTSETDVTDAVVLDELSGVLAHASFQGINGPVDGAASVSGSTLTWTLPSLPAGESTTLSYRVMVHPTAADVVLRNVVTTPSPDGGCTENCTTTHLVPGWSLSKSSNPVSGTAVQVGDTITYTVTVKVTPTAPASGIVVTDDLSEVLGKAVLLTGSINASLGTATVSGNELIWNVGTVAADGTATLTYQAIVQSAAQGARIKNVVTATGDVPYTSCDPCTTEHPVGRLPVTGSESAAMAGLAAILMAGGLLLVLVSRRRKRA